MGLRTLAQIYRETLEARPAAGPAAGSAARREPPRAIPSAGPAGMLLAFDVEGLVAEARRCDAELVLVPAPGDFVRTGSPLFHAFESGTPVDAGRLRASVLLEDLRQIAPGERRPAVERELALLGEAVRRGFVDAEEQVRAGVPDSQGLGSSPR
jgi:uncharacterized membrane protein